MLMTILLALTAAIPNVALAAAAPEVPSSEVQAIQQDNVYVLRNLIDDSPLYTFDKDEPGKSNCTGACAMAWRPLWAPDGAKPVGKWSPVKRDDGSNQWAYEGKPVYSFARDPEPVAIGNGTGRWQLLPTFPAQ